MDSLARTDDAPMLHEVSGELAQLLAALDAADVDEDGEVAAPVDLLARIADLRVELGPAIEAVAGRIESRETLAAAIDEAAARLHGRSLALRARAERDREAVRRALVATSTRKIEGPLYTVALRQGSESVEVTDPAAIPVEYRRAPAPPPPPSEWPADKKAAKEVLKRGDTIPGLALVKGAPTLTIK